MSRSSGAGSPVWFRCAGERDSLSFGNQRHEVVLTGNEKPYHPPRAIGSRSTFVSRQYRCLTCGHVGWSNHIDLARRAEAEAT